MNNKLNLIYRPYEEVEHLIKEGDILLFRGQGWISSLLKVSGEGVHTHVGICSWHNGGVNIPPILECVEFKEWTGGRSVVLRYQIEQNDCLVDLYRPVPYFTSLQYNRQLHNPYLDENQIDIERKAFNGKLVTNTMREMTGLPYGWRRIRWLAQHKLLGLRLLYSKEDLIDDTLKDIVYPVCSTAMAYSFSKHGYDLIKNKADQWTEPSHIACSARLNYLFTLCTKDHINEKK